MGKLNWFGASAGKGETMEPQERICPPAPLKGSCKFNVNTQQHGHEPGHWVCTGTPAPAFLTATGQGKCNNSYHKDSLQSKGEFAEVMEKPLLRAGSVYGIRKSTKYR